MKSLKHRSQLFLVNKRHPSVLANEGQPGRTWQLRFPWMNNPLTKTLLLLVELESYTRHWISSTSWWLRQDSNLRTFSYQVCMHPLYHQFIWNLWIFKKNPDPVGLESSGLVLKQVPGMPGTPGISEHYAWHPEFQIPNDIPPAPHFSLLNVPL